jgi:asparagine synthetase B (glutamine-hydrolysing)
MIVDKKYCMSSFLSFRYVVDENKVFAEGISHKNLELTPECDKIACNTAEEIDAAIKKQLDQIDLSQVGILLSGGMDSAILASYMPKGTRAYTAKCDAPNAVDETGRARKYCEINGLEHVIVDITWDDYQKNIDKLMLSDGCPVFANEPQVYRIVQKMKEDGIDYVIFGDNADMAFGGYDRLLSKDWTYSDWKERFTFVNPFNVLVEAENMDVVYSDYKIGENDIDYIRFMNEIFASSSSGAYVNAFKTGEMKYLDPYAKMKMGMPFDFNRIRNGESKYLIRELFKMKYPQLEVPEKIAMARAVDYWLKDWEGPKRSEFKENCINGMTGEQKFLVYSLERFLNLIER